MWRASLVLFLFSFSLFAKEVTYVVNSQHSYLNFDISFMRVSTVKGTFPRLEAKFLFDDEKNIIKRVHAKVSVKDISTNDSRRDQHLRGTDFFNVGNYPYFFFDAKNVDLKKGFSELNGEVTIKGVKRKVKWSILHKGARKDNKGFESRFFIVRGNIKRSDFGLNWNKILEKGEYLLGDLVKFEMVLETHPIGKVPQFSRFFTLDKKERAMLKEKSKLEGVQQLDDRTLLNKELMLKDEQISSKNRMIGFLKDEIEVLKSKIDKLNNQNEKLKTPPQPLWIRILIFLGATAGMLGILFFVFKQKADKGDAELFDYSRDQLSKKSMWLDTLFLLTIFAYSLVVFKFVI